MSDSESSALSSAPPDILDDPAVTAPASANGAKKRKAETAPAPVNKRARKDIKTPASEGVKASPRKVKKTKIEIKEVVGIETEDEATAGAAKSTPKKAKKSTKQTVKVEEEPGESVKTENNTKPKRKRKTKEEKEAEAMPLAARTLGSKVLVGAHVSSAGGVHNAVMNSVHIGGNAFALFLKSQRKWENPPLQDEHLKGFMSSCKEHKYDNGHGHGNGEEKGSIPPIVPHGSYLVNLAHPDPARTKQAYDAFLDDLTRCARLGIRLYNFHPGSCGASESRSHAITHLAGQLNKAHKDPSSGNVITLLETMTSSTNILGATFEDLAETIEQIEDKERVGVCLDTCHVFAAGYDLRTPEVFRQTMQRFDEVVGLKYLKALHMNDSKAPLNSGRDLHANIGTGFLGLRAFHNIMNEPRLWGLPMILETPIDVKDGATGKEVPDKGIWAREIKLLEGLVGMDVKSEEFKTLERELWEKGKEERDRIQGQVDRKGKKAEEKVKKAKEKEEKAKGKAKGGKATKKKSKKAVESSSEGESSGDDS